MGHIMAFGKILIFFGNDESSFRYNSLALILLRASGLW